MANPKIVNLEKNDWTLVAANVTEGFIKKLDYRPTNYLETYRVAGESAPISQIEGSVIFLGKDYAEISSSSPIDVYILAVGFPGKVRVDIE